MLCFPPFRPIRGSLDPRFDVVVRILCTYCGHWGIDTLTKCKEAYKTYTVLDEPALPPRLKVLYSGDPHNVSAKAVVLGTARHRP